MHVHFDHIVCFCCLIKHSLLPPFMCQFWADKKRRSNILKITLPAVSSLLILVFMWFVWICYSRGTKFPTFVVYSPPRNVCIYSLLHMQSSFISFNVVPLFLSVKERNKKTWKKVVSGVLGTSDELGDANLPCISFREIVLATNNFSSSNMLGHGGFGHVYKVMTNLFL